MQTPAQPPQRSLAPRPGAVATRNHGGTGAITAKLGNATASASITVKLEVQFADANAPAGAAERFRLRLASTFGLGRLAH